MARKKAPKKARKKERAKLVKPGLYIGDCLQIKQNAGRAECGLIFASYLLREPKKLRGGDKERIQAGLATAKGVLGQMTVTASVMRNLDHAQAMESTLKKAKAAASSALNLVKKAEKLPKGEALDKLKKAVKKAHDAHTRVVETADRLCMEGRE